jgi:hypothetical protein
MAKSQNPQEQQIERLFTLYGDMAADKAHSLIKEHGLMKTIPKRGDVRTAWRTLRASDVEVTYYATEDGRRFKSRQGRYRYCKRTGATPIRPKRGA